MKIKSTLITRSEPSSREGKNTLITRSEQNRFLVKLKYYMSGNIKCCWFGARMWAARSESRGSVSDWSRDYVLLSSDHLWGS